MTGEILPSNGDSIDTGDGSTRRMDDGFCVSCGEPLSPVTGIHIHGRDERSGVCPDCNSDGVGSLTIVQNRPSEITDRTRKRLQRRRKRANAQATESAAAFIDQRVPAGEYRVRRVAPTKLNLTWSDDVAMTKDLRGNLEYRLRHSGVWYVQTFGNDGGFILTDTMHEDDPTDGGSR